MRTAHQKRIRFRFIGAYAQSIYTAIKWNCRNYPPLRKFRFLDSPLVVGLGHFRYEQASIKILQICSQSILAPYGCISPEPSLDVRLLPKQASTEKFSLNFTSKTRTWEWIKLRSCSCSTLKSIYLYVSQRISSSHGILMTIYRVDSNNETIKQKTVWISICCVET